MLKHLMCLTKMLSWYPVLHQMVTQLTNDDELEHNNNVFDNNNCSYNDETMTEQQGASKDEGYKMAADCSNPPIEEQSLLSTNTNDDFTVDLSRILNICDDMEVN